MWTSILDQIQQRIDDAVDLLGDEEVEYSAEGVTTRGTPSVAPFSSTEKTSTGARVTDSLPIERLGTEADRDPHRERLDDDGTSKSISAPAPLHAPRLAPEPLQIFPSVSLPSPPPASVAVSGTPPKLADASALNGTPIVPLPEPRLTHTDAASEQPMSLVTQEFSAESSSLPRLPTPKSPWPLLAAADAALPPAPSQNAGACEAAPLLAPYSVETEVALLTLDAIAGATETPSVPPSLGDKELTFPTNPPAPLSAAAKNSSSSPPSLLVATEESGGVEQLLRFQQQLAEEMENAAALQRENASLRDRLNSLEEELTRRDFSAANKKDIEMQVSLLIEKLGKEKERHKAAAMERNELQAQVRYLEEDVEEYRVREAEWLSANEQNQASEMAAQQRIIELEKNLRDSDARATDLEKELQDQKYRANKLQSQLDELKQNYSTELDTVKDSNADTVDQLRHEVERLRSALQNMSAEYETQVAHLERETQQAHMRAHQAEGRLNEVELGSVNTLRDLRSELEDVQRSSAFWKVEAQKTRSEYADLIDQCTSLKRSRASAEAVLQDRIRLESNAAAALRKDIQDWEDRHVQLQKSLEAAQTELEQQRKTIHQLELSVTKVNANSPEVSNRASDEVQTGVPASQTKSPSVETLSSSFPTNGPQIRRHLSVPPPLPFMNLEWPAWPETTDRKTRERLEEEVVRQSTEIEHLRRSVSEKRALKSRYEQLEGEHDLLLQLYGQLEEEMLELKRKVADSSHATATAQAG